MKCLLPYLCMVTVPHVMVRLERMLDYRGFKLARFHCNTMCMHFLEINMHMCMYVCTYSTYIQYVHTYVQYILMIRTLHMDVCSNILILIHDMLVSMTH